MNRRDGNKMDETIDMDFYRDRDEQAFLEAWEAKNGPVSDDELDELYLNIAASVDEQVKNGTHKLGEVFVYEGVAVGESDYNTFHQLYLFQEAKEDK
ncbi:hypothetical protein [Atopococcus tabaci]|uniref:hypothetical protein n=2 Tax=Atopococcus tabaci TaxID=269774 RepID=UPI00240A2631|nr:hypothetical protein [Atopococcus tabaci]